ncbi:glycosyltransferase [Spirosoma sordidisoli]|uniref:Glycosyltransferase n=1 Tax=Spirosoma sordidisoli TaxID=2502893 RepID=A0A4Q2URE3_9BACT|nr:glycosyltransferase family 2 protein [Spirosoma sordidisoli]RYC72124.1 glycosyltransferase [Spirosoma sordidisoli]
MVLIFQWAAAALFLYTGLVVLYLLFFALAGRLRKNKNMVRTYAATSQRIAVLIPAYREDGVILESAQQGLLQTYPASMYDVIVIADSLQPETIQTLRKLPIQVIEVSFEKSTKAKALNVALQQLPTTYDIAVILDADNLMAPDFLQQINTAFQQGWRIVQGHRVAKNTDSSVAVLDAISEEINNHIFRQGHRSVGLSAALIGSGMAFEYALLRQIMPEVQAVGGFDKELEMRLLSQRIPFTYVANAFVYDEKVPNEAVFERQRTRWIAAQYKYLRLNFRSGIRSLLEGNIDYADKVFQTLIPPRILLMGGLLLAVIASALVNSPVFLLITGIQLALLLITFYISTPNALIRQIGPAELLKLPVLFTSFIKSIYKMKTAKNQFLHTPHSAKGVSQ